MKTISIFGLGYVGCVSAACFAKAGYRVIGVDPNEEKVRLINEGKSPIVEPGLGAVLASVVKSGQLTATTSCDEAVAESDLAFICVGTPGNEHGQLQYTALNRVAEDIGNALQKHPGRFTVVIRSTVLPGVSVSQVYEPLLALAGPDNHGLIRLAVNPEFIREGAALKDFANPPFTLVGCQDKETADLLHEIYSHLDAPFVQTDINTSETVKYVSNSFHALKVCFANEVADVCSRLDVDAHEVMRIFCLDSKLNISPAYLRPGFAFGGSCLPKDLKALLYCAHHLDVPTPLLDAILPSNELQIQRAIDNVLATGNKRVGVVGLSFKPETDDLRESPMVRVVEALIGKGLSVRILDHNVSIAKLTGANRSYIIEEIPHISMLMCDDRDTLLDHSDTLLIGSDTPEATDVLDHMHPEQILVDLTRGWLGRNSADSVKARAA